MARGRFEYSGLPLVATRLTRVMWTFLSRSTAAERSWIWLGWNFAWRSCSADAWML